VANVWAVVGSATLLFPLHRVLALFRVVPSLKCIADARRDLIAFSNRLYRGPARENDERRKRVQEALRIPLVLR
jgi:hypothetical protein